MFLDALLKLFKTTYPQKLFPSDCSTLYNTCVWYMTFNITIKTCASSVRP